MLHHLSLSNCDVPDQALKNMEVSKEGTHTRMPQSQPLQFAPEMLSSLWQHSPVSLHPLQQARQAELDAARLQKEKEEEEAKQAAQQAKKEKEIQKKAIKKERQKLRTTCKVHSH